MNDKDPENNKRIDNSILAFILSAIVFIMSLKFLIEGEVRLPPQGMVLYGMQARSLATMMLLVSIIPWIFKLIKKRKKNAD